MAHNETPTPEGRGARRIWNHLSLRSQLVATTTVLAALVAIGLIVVVQIVLAGAANRASENVLDGRAAALVSGIGTASTDTRIKVPRAQLDPGVAVYDADGRQIAGSAPPSMSKEFAELSRATRPKVVEGGEHFAIMAKPFRTTARTRGVVVLTERLAPYERNEQAALIVSLVAGALLVVLASGCAAWISKRVLSPVQHMARTADEWSEHDLERRFALGPPTNEIRALGNTLDGLLDKVATVIRGEQRLTSELAHELRTPLTTIQGAVDLLAMRTDLDDEAQEDLALIKSTTTAMSETITVLLTLSRRRGGTLRLDRTSLADLQAAIENLPRGPGRVVLTLDHTMVIDVPQAVAVRAIAPVLANALRAGEQVRISARLRGRSVEILVADDGPGIPDESLESLFTPGWSSSAGSGLGLSLSRRVARSGGGDVTLVEQHNEHGGATFAITFPGATLSGRRR